MHYQQKIHDCFKLSARRQPSAPAIITDDVLITYAELDAASEKLAIELQTRGIKIEESIGVFTERSADLPAAFLAILKAGGVYVPLAADLPADRLANMAEQAGIRRLIVLDGIEIPPALRESLLSNGSSKLSEVVIRPEELSAGNTGASTVDEKNSRLTTLAAILFTSGSSGTPKGVTLTHAACINMVLGHIDAQGITSKDRILLSSSPVFILGFRSLCIPLISGSAFVPVMRSTIDTPDRLLELMSLHKVSIAFFTPSYLHLLNGAVPKGLRCIMTAGELPNADDAQHYARHVDYWNIYGATEVCGTICMHHVDPDEKGAILSGRPFANTKVYLLDEDGNEVPKGEIGEVHVIGTGVSPGYLKQPELNTEYFVETRYGRAFRSHDLARWNSNDELETLGRSDNAVKISGQTVSLDEIELTLQRHPRVKTAKLVHLKDRIFAFVECQDSREKEAVNWREFLQKRLPSYMIPAHFTVLDNIPLNSAGKADQKALKAIAEELFNNGSIEQGGSTPPMGPLELTIAAVWEELLDFRPIMREQNFFSAGGTSLLAIAVSQRLHLLGYNVPVQMVLSALNVKALAEYIASIEEESDTHLNSDLSVSNSATADQEDFWIASEIGLAPVASHIVRFLRVHGKPYSQVAWQSAWTRLLDRHAALRTAFYEDEKKRIRWKNVSSGELSRHAVLRLDHCCSMEEARSIAAHWRNERVLLTDPPLARAGIVRIDEGNETLFWFVLHHSLVDGISARLIQDDLLALLDGRQLPPAPNGVAMASSAEQHYLNSKRAEHDRRFWMRCFDTLAARGSEAFSEYVRDRQRPSLPGKQGSEPLVEQLDGSTVHTLGLLAKSCGIGLHALLLAILASEIRRRSGLSDIMVGSGITIRPAGGERAVGHFVNLLPVILLKDGDLPFSEHLRNTQSALTETVEHAAYPSGMLYREFRQRHPDLRPRARTSLFDIALTAIPSRTISDPQSELTLEPLSLSGELEHPAAGLDLSFSHEPFSDSGGGLNLLLSWNSDVCSIESARAWLSSFAAWARWLAEEPERIHQPLPPLHPSEMELLQKWEEGKKELRPDQRGHEMFEAIADQYPNRPALISREHSATFRQIDSLANGIAVCLMDHGVVRGTTVGVLASGPENLPATVLAIWKAGGAYLPLAFDIPAARLASIAKDAGAKHLIVLDRLTPPRLLCSEVESIIFPEECSVSGLRPKRNGSTDDIAYIIYTSGTTGTPKGVPVTHSAYINTILGVADRIGLRDSDRIALVSTISFDASLWEIGHGLLNGITLVPISPSLREDPWQMKPYYQELGVTIAFHTPSYLRVSEKIPFEGLRLLLTGGEAPNHQDVSLYADQLAFWNFYGPTEATIVVSGGLMMSDHDPEKPLHVGSPLPNMRISIRRDDGSPVPPCVKGELWLGGMGIAHGYLNQPEQYARHFVDTPEGLFYRSGDYGRWNTEGQVEITGRIDQQIKLNGQRVELGEIEQMLCKHPSVVNAAVLADELQNGVKVLRAFVQPENMASFSQVHLLEFLTLHLSPHMVPASIMPIAVIPLTPSGKVDREVLFNYAKELQKETDRQMPLNPLEKRVADIWADVLCQTVERNDNFFALGGNSLLAVTLAHRVSETLRRPISARTLFASPTLSAFVEKISSLVSISLQETIEQETDLASEGEKEFWIAESAGLDTRNFIIPVHYLINQEVTVDRLQDAWGILVKRHEGLRTFFEDDESGMLRRRLALKIDWTLESSVAYSTVDAIDLIRNRQFSSLSMSAAPLWRAGIVEAEQKKKRFFWLALHHSIGDGQSIGTLFNELAILLDGDVLSPLCPCGMVFASREQAYFASNEARRDGRYWETLLNRVPDSAFEEWPLDMARSSRSAPGSHRFELLLDGRTAESLKTLARIHHSTLHSLILTLLALEAGRRTTRRTIMIGTTASVRESASDFQIIGYGVNMLPLHLNPERHRTFGELLQSTQQSLAEALQHARLPFSNIYRSSWNKRPELRNPLRYPLFDIAVTENPGGRKDGAARFFTSAKRTIGPISYESTCASPGQDMVLIHENLQDGELLLQWHVNAAIYTEQTARLWLESLKGWAHWLAEKPEHAAEPLPDLLPEEERILSSWQQGEIVERPPLRFHELFERIADRPDQADRPAVITPDSRLSYRCLNEEANAIAHALLQQGAARGSVVAVLAGRSSQLPAALLGIWKSGATYLPLSMELPAERMSFMTGDAEVSHLIVLDGIAVPEELDRIVSNPLRPEELSEPFRQQYSKRALSDGQPDDIAYILYTSGSTGKPKGTLIAHDSLVNMVLGAAKVLDFHADDRSLLFASPSFDVSLSDIGVPLASGAAICPVPKHIIESPKRFLDFLQELRITVADITPTYLGLLEGVKLPASLRALVTGGETPSAEDVKRYAPHLNYFNAYGPTENTITSTMGILKVDERRFFTAGRPLPNTSVYICNDEGHTLAPGVTGEIWLGGVGISQGYLNRPELTAASFMESTHGRRYRTGDLGRWHANGTLEIIGRIDDQVKMNGIRIELGEIEYALTSHPAISQAVVLLDEQRGGAKSLWGVVRFKPGEQIPEMEEWKSFLMERLPSHMIPSGVISVPSIPLMVSGKVDRAALLALLNVHPSSTGLTPPQDELEQYIAGIWAELLERSPIHREDNFFALGGHSLLAIAVAHRLEKKLGHEVPARELFAEPTLAGFSERVRELQTEESVDDLLSDLATEGEREFWTAEQAGFETSGFNIPLTLLLHGEVPAAERWKEAWNTIIYRHDALRTGFCEDGTGILRRVVAEHVDTTLEYQFAPSFDEALSRINRRQREPFCMSNPGLWRAGLTGITESSQTIFWFVLHHAVGDGLSLGILIEELSALLRGALLAPLNFHFNRSAAREAAYLGSKTAQLDAQYWQLLLSELVKSSPDALDEWPLDKLRPIARSVSSPGSHCFRTRLDPATANVLRSLAKKNKATLHALMLTLLGLEVRRRTARTRFLLGTAASVRQSDAEMRVIGYFINMLPLACHSPESATIDAALQNMQQHLAEALQHSKYPFARIYRDFRRQRQQAEHPGRYPLFDIAVTENPAFTVTAETNPGFSAASAPPEPDITSYELRRNAPAQDMVLVHEGTGDGGLVITWYVNAALYTKDTALTWFDALIGWMRFFSKNPNQSALPPPLLLPEEEKQLECWQKGPLRTWPVSTFPELFERIASLYPNRPALITENSVQSFEMINKRSDALARAILKLDVHRGETVGVLTERSASLPETVLAVWKAGACYLPLTADLPAERLAFMARDSSLRNIIALDALAVPPQLCSDEINILRPEELLAETVDLPVIDTAITPDDPAYIIYTSGSTGLPKGVVLSHKGVLNLGLGEAEIFALRTDDRVMQISSPSFDLWISDLARTWSASAALVPVRRQEMNDISGMQKLILQRGITIATMSPSYLRLFEQADFPTLRLIMTVGEPPVADDFRYYAARLSYLNGYGPTENTAATSVGRILHDTEQIHAGRPLANTTVYVVNENGKPCPPGVTGEIWVGGSRVAIGYLNRPDLTKAAFVYRNGERLYRTGDLGRWLRTGDLQILGRSDTQVKLHGQRVELGEIEHRLVSWPGVQQAATIVETRPDQSQILRSFVTMTAGIAMPEYGEWVSYLSATLPSYMVPASIVSLAALPLTAAGKVDRQALLQILDETESSPTQAVVDTNCYALRTPPQNTIEKRISHVWSEQLKKPLPAREDHFFELGGDSLSAIAVINRLGREFDCTVNNLYEHPVLSDFALFCHPRPDHLREVLGRLCTQHYKTESILPEAEHERKNALQAQRGLYEERMRSERNHDLLRRRPRRHILLTGATGYLGSYLLHELLADNSIHVTVPVRCNKSIEGCARLGRVFSGYFGTDAAQAMLDNPRLTVLSSDLRHEQMLLSQSDYGKLAESVDAIYHCAANVNHIGHYRDFLADNVSATRHLLTLATREKTTTTDFHFISTLSVSASALPVDFKLFTEYDSPPEVPDDNYYIRTKQEAERLVMAYRTELQNSSIYRVGNISFASEGSQLQQNIKDNAFFRQLAAFLRLGAVPANLPASLCHVDLVARSIIALSSREALTNKIHHIETSRRDSLATLMLSANGTKDKIRACSFGEFLKRLRDAVDEPEMESAVAETVENYALQSDSSLMTRRQRVVIASDRTQRLLHHFGIIWPAIPKEGIDALLNMAMMVNSL